MSTSIRPGSIPPGQAMAYQALDEVIKMAIDHQERADAVIKDMTLSSDTRLERVSKHVGASLALKQAAIRIRHILRGPLLGK